MMNKSTISRSRPRPPRSSRSGNESVEAAVRRYIESSVEQKCSIYEALNIAIGSRISTDFVAAQIVPLCPYNGFNTIAQGVTEATRVGNEVKISKVTFKAVFCPLPYNAGTNTAPRPLNIILHIFKLREDGVISDVDTVTQAAGSFYDLGASSVGMVGNLYDVVGLVNKDVIIHHKSMVLKLGFAINGGTGTSASFQSFTNNDYKLNQIVELDCTPFVTKNVKWNDTGSIPTSHKTYLVFEAVCADGSDMVAADRMAEISYQVRIHYTDL